MQRKIIISLPSFKIIWFIYVLIFYSSPNSYSGTPRLFDCHLNLEISTTLIAQKPLESKIKLKISDEYGSKNNPYPFDLTGTDFQCEIQFYGADRGSFINCWKKDLSMGIQSDRTTDKGKGIHKTIHALSVTKGNESRSSVKFFCD